MHSPSLESPADLMTWLKGGCDLGHRGQQAIKNPARGGAFCLFSSIRRLSSFDEITNGGATKDTRDAVDGTNTRNKANDTVDNVFPEAAALHGLQIVFVDGLSGKSLSGHEFEVS